MAEIMVRVGKLSQYRTIGRRVGAVFIMLSIGLLASCFGNHWIDHG
jgi:general secretion pathway protein D